MVHKVTDLSSDQRLTLEGLVGRSLREDESVVVRPCRVIKAAPQGQERLEAARQYLAHLDMLAERAKDVPQDQLEAAIEEACEYAKHGSHE